MENFEILSRVDHTLLTPFASWDEITRLCKEAVEYKTASVCIPPSYVQRVSDEFGSVLNICTVVGFPNGYSVKEAKLSEVSAALGAGAAEIDMVINLGDVKNHDYNKIENEISELKKAVEDNILKVIIETCFLNEEEKIALCHAVTKAGADYIKTSTGFGTAGATMEDVLLFKKHIGSSVKIKAAGGIKTRQDMIDYITFGCDRLGTSSAIKILTSGKPEGY